MIVRRQLACVIAVAVCGSAGCLFVSDFDRFDPDAVELVAGDGGSVIVPADGSGPFTVRAEVPAFIDATAPGKIVVIVERASPEPLRLVVTLPAEMTVEPARTIDLDAQTSRVTLEVDTSLALRGPVRGSARVERLDGSAAQTVDLAFRVTGPGDLDTTFGSGGVAVVSEVEYRSDTDEALAARSVVPSGEALYVAGYKSSDFQPSWQVARLTSAGLDPAFGVAGLVVDPPGVKTDALSALARTDGVWVAGAARGSKYSAEVRRYGLDGALLGSTPLGLAEGDAPSVLIAPAGAGAWVAHSDNTPFDVPAYEEVVLTKLDASGAIVAGPFRNAIPMRNSLQDFGDTRTGFGGVPGALRLAGNRLLHAFVLRDYIGGVPARVAAYVASGPSEGSLDPTFGQGGIAATSAAPGDLRDVGVSLAPRSDGSFFLVGGRLTPTSTTTVRKPMLVRSFTAGGALAPGFVDALGGCEGMLYDAVADPQGRVIVVGRFGSPARGGMTRHSVALVRLLPNGEIDRTFGAPTLPDALCGIAPGVSTKGLGGFDVASALSVAIDGAGRLVVAGWGARLPIGSATGKESLFVARFRL